MRLAKERENITTLWPMPDYFRLFLGCVTVISGRETLECRIFAGRLPNTKTPAICIISQDRRKVKIMRTLDDRDYDGMANLCNWLETQGKFLLDDLEIIGFDLPAPLRVK